MSYDTLYMQIGLVADNNEVWLDESTRRGDPLKRGIRNNGIAE